MKSNLWVGVALSATLLSACGGGGGGGSSPPAPSPTVMLTATPTSVAAGGTSTLTWSSTNAAGCTASGGWSGAKATSGSEQTATLDTNTSFTLNCSGAIATATVTVTAIQTTTVSGQLIVPANVQTDSDTNDVLLTPVANNSFDTAQLLQNPTIVGGYVNEAGSGPTGPLQANGDVSDFFSVSLAAGQTIQLTVANPQPDQDDLDLELFDAARTPIDESVGLNRVETLVAPATGQYFIHVLAYSGASNYLLSIGQPTGTSVPALTTSREFVPGEILVKMRATSIGQSKPQVAASALGLEVARATPGMHSLVRVGTGTANALTKQRPALASKRSLQIGNRERQRKSLTLLAIKELRKRADVEWAEPNWILRASATPNDTLYERQRWHYEQMQMPAAWDVTTGSANVIAAVVDSGVRPHAELQPSFVEQADFVDEDFDASDPGYATQGNYVFHGTHVAGSIGAAGNDNRGVTGVAWNVKLMPIRVLGTNGGGSLDDIMNGVAFAARLNNSSGQLPAKRADVINLSLGALGSCPQAAQEIIDAARAAGSIIVAAAGNENTSQPSMPAVCDGVISVAALDVSRERAPYSNFGDTVDVAAPGGNVGVDRDGDGYPDGVYSTHSTRNANGTFGATHTYLQGTSMASPHVAGVMALMRAVNPSITPAQIDTLLANGELTDDIGTPGRDSLGVGLINAFKAVRAASANPPTIPARLNAVPSSLNFGDVATSNDVIVANAGNGPISVTAVEPSAAWIVVSAVEVNAAGLGRYRIQVDRAGLAPGTYSGSVEFRSSPTASARVTVLMQVAGAGGPIEANAGQHYLLLTDPVTGESRYQVEVIARGSSVAFTFPAVAPGQYELVVGTDANNDGLICDDGEACGQYPVYGEPNVIEVSGAVTGLIVPTSYRTDVAPTAANTISESGQSQSGARRLR